MPTRKRRTKARPRLTPRQRQCLVLVAKGKTDRQVGRTLRISGETVHKHVESIKKAYRARSRMQLVIRALVVREITLHEIA